MLDQVRDSILPTRLENNKNPPFPTFFADGDKELPEDLFDGDMFQFGEAMPEWGCDPTIIASSGFSTAGLRDF